MLQRLFRFHRWTDAALKVLRIVPCHVFSYLVADLAVGKLQVVQA